MEPAFQRGDLLLLSTIKTPIEVGDITVFNIDGRPVPIVHRVLQIHTKLISGSTTTSKQSFLTKGDHNTDDDRVLYNRNQLWVTKKEVVGRVWAYIPTLGLSRSSCPNIHS
ncbi:hypothetical protein HDU83_009051 [Entophlyctis luteolus]|nr:hypothetical protein HDU83_009051 [Entophlyctis luteolus]